MLPPFLIVAGDNNSLISPARASCAHAKPTVRARVYTVMCNNNADVWGEQL